MSETNKQVPKWAKEEAEAVPLLTYTPVPRSTQASIARALLAAYRRGCEDAAKLMERRGWANAADVIRNGAMKP